jgi:predicted GIY-YIG superfamily endonuclease
MMLAWGCIVWLFGFVIWFFRLVFRTNRQPIYYGYVLKNGRKIFYVGQTQHPRARLNQHLRGACVNGTKKQRYIYQMLRKGKRPSMQVKTKMRDKAAINVWERKHIRKWGATNIAGK